MYTDTIIYIIAEWTNNICMIQTYITWHIKMINSWFWYTALSIKEKDVHLPGYLLTNKWGTSGIQMYFQVGYFTLVMTIGALFVII